MLFAMTEGNARLWLWPLSWSTRFVQFSVATRIVILVETKIVQFYVATRFVQFSIIWRICIKQSGGSFSFITSWQCSDKIRKYQGHIETFGRRKKIKILMRFPEIKTKNLFYYWTDNRILVPRHQRYGAPILLLVDILLVNPFTCC